MIRIKKEEIKDITNDRKKSSCAAAHDNEQKNNNCCDGKKCHIGQDE